MIGSLGEQASRPLGERERRGLFALAIAVVLGAAALLLALPPDSPRPPLAGAAPVAAAVTAHRATPPRPEHKPGKVVEATTRRFLRGYLAFLYGRGSASAIEATTAGIRHRLAGARLRVPPAALRRHPRVTEVELRRVRGDRFAATAGIDDGGPARYPIELTVARDHDRWRVAEVAEH